MEHMDRIDFTDHDTEGSGFAGVRVCGNSIALTLSLEENGDIQVVLDLEAAAAITTALERAIIAVRSGASE